VACILCVPRSGMGDFLYPMEITNWLVTGASIIWLVVAFLFYGKTHQDHHFDWVRFISRVAIFGAISTILYIVPVFQIQLPFVPSFLQLHFDEIPAFIAGYAYGPWTAIAVLFIKSVIKLPMSTTLCVGELCDFLYSTAFILPAALIYKKHRNLKGVAWGFLVGTILQLIVSSVMNAWVMLPFYVKVYSGLTMDILLAMCQAVNPAIKNLTWDYILYVNLPFNLIKDGLVLAVTFLVYRSIHKILHFDRAPKSLH
jgi:riboflavin transporter FmnP